MSMRTLLKQVGLPSVLLAALAALGGCGGGGSTEGSNAEMEPRLVHMELAAEYTVQPNDRIVVTSPDPARFSVRHDSSTNVRQVILLSGRAELQRSVAQAP